MNDDELTVDPPSEENTPTITPADRLASEILDAIEAIAGRIAVLQIPHSTTAPHVRGGRTVSNDAIISMIAAVEAEPRLQQLGTFDVDDARAMLQFNHAFDPVMDRLNLLTASLSFTMEAWKARVAFHLMRTYGIMKGIARDPGSAELGNHVENLRRDLGRTAHVGPSEASEV